MSSDTAASDISTWLRDGGFGEYVAKFAENHIGLDDLAALTSEDLKEIGVGSLGHRKKLLAEIQKLAVQAPAQRPEPPPTETPAAPPRAKAPAVPPPTKAPAAPAPPAEKSISAASDPAKVAPEVAAPKSSPATKRAGFWAKLLTRKFLLISVALHVLFGLGATYFIVQRVQAKRKVTFQGGPPSTNPSKRALEHKVSMAQKKKTGGAPPQPKRIVTAGLAKVTLPDLPSIPTATTVVPGMRAGMGGAGFGSGMGMGSGMGSGMGGGGGGGGGMTLFGFRGGGPGLVGRFYDLSQTPSGSRTKIQNTPAMLEEVNRFLSSGWSESVLNKYFVAPNRLNCRQLFVPRIASQTAPEAYEVEKQVKPDANGLLYWLAHYKGQVSPPESGIYHFVGGGDAVLVVRLNRATVLHKSWNYNETPQLDPNWHHVARYDYPYPAPPHSIPTGFNKGQGVDLKAGVWYDMEVLIGDQGGMCNFTLLVEKAGAEYQKTPAGLPILPLFRTGKDKIAPGEHPPFQDNGPVWQAKPVLGWR